MLSRATYPEIWDRGGYPPMPILPALVGDVIHRALELILRSLHSHGCQSLVDPRAVETLKELGGYSKLIESVIDEQMEQLQGNPRAAPQLSALQTALAARVPDIRRRVQGIITRTKLEPSSGDTHIAEVSHRLPLAPGSYPEVELRAPELRFAGRADLVTVTESGCNITDYKTGAQHDHHFDQLRTYALLWSQDSELNPRQLPTECLVVAYVTHETVVDGPGEAELNILAKQLKLRIDAADKQLRLRPPPARPSPTMCRLCGVRHLCEDYWEIVAPGKVLAASPDTVDFTDCEVVVESRNGPRSWIVRAEPGHEQALLRTDTESAGFGSGDRVRLLNLALGGDDDSGTATLTLTRASETFVLEP
jgi:hypothetical protein